MVLRKGGKVRRCSTKKYNKRRKTYVELETELPRADFMIFDPETDEGFLLCMELLRLSRDGLAEAPVIVGVALFELNSGFCKR